MRFPRHRYFIVDGVCRQDAPGGRWVQLSPEETDELLARLDGFAPPMPSVLRQLPDEAFEPLC